jgi:hypothetical protein
MYIYFFMRFQLSIIKALHTKQLIDKNSPQIKHNLIDSSWFIYWVNIFFLYSKKDFRKTFIKEIVQKFANSRQKLQSHTIQKLIPDQTKIKRTNELIKLSHRTQHWLMNPLVLSMESNTQKLGIASRISWCNQIKNGQQ